MVIYALDHPEATMHFLNIIALFILNLICFYVAYKSIEISKNELQKITTNPGRITIFKWLTSFAFIVQTIPWVGIWIGYAIKKNNYHVSVIENFWPLTRLTLFCVLTAIFLVGVAIIFEVTKKHFSRN